MYKVVVQITTKATGQEQLAITKLCPTRDHIRGFLRELGSNIESYDEPFNEDYDGDEEEDDF